VNLAVRAVFAATRRDTASGEGIDVAVIDRNGITMRHYRLGDVIRLVRP